MVVVANEVIPVSRSLVTGIQYHYILLLLFMGCFASSHGSCGGEETEREREREKTEREREIENFNLMVPCIIIQY